MISSIGHDDSRDGGQNGGDDADRSDYDCFECSLYLLCELGAWPVASVLSMTSPHESSWQLARD